MSVLHLKSCVPVSVIGSAGRRSDQFKMTLELYNAAIDKTIDMIWEKLKVKPTNARLVSGGAAWTDHIAVVLFLQKKVKQLLLHFPARWITEPTPHFEDNGKSDQHNPGKMANRYHGYFSRITGINSLMQIQQALQTGASFEVHNGFHERNKHVAMSSKLVAFTWGEGDKPKPGGTLQTWRLCKGQKVHISYTTLLKPNIGANNKQKCGQKRECSRSLTSLLVKPSKVYKPSAVLVVEENEEYLRQFEGFDMFSTGEDVH